MRKWLGRVFALTPVFNRPQQRPRCSFCFDRSNRKTRRAECRRLDSGRISPGERLLSLGGSLRWKLEGHAASPQLCPKWTLRATEELKSGGWSEEPRRRKRSRSFPLIQYRGIDLRPDTNNTQLLRDVHLNDMGSTLSDVLQLRSRRKWWFSI